MTERGAEGSEWTRRQIGVTAVLLEKDSRLNILTHIHMVMRRMALRLSQDAVH